MKKTHKIVTLGFSSLLVIGVILSLVVGALAATQNFTLLGALVDEGGGAWSVKGVVFLVDASTVCYAADGTTVLDCATLTAGTLVEVQGTYDDAVDPIVRTATTITVQDGSKTYTYIGIVEEIASDYWMVDEYKFWLQDTTLLPDFYGVGDTVEVNFSLSTEAATLGEYLANEIKVLESSATYTYTGILLAASGESWTVGDYDFVVPTAVQPPFFAVNDEVEVTFSIVGGEFVASQVVVLNSGEGNAYTFEGVLTGLSEDKTIWTVTDDGGVAYDFFVSADLWPIYFGLQDRVKITFVIVAQDYVATAVEVIETFVPPKTESERCLNRTKDHPAIVKLAAEVGVDVETLTMYFCQGFGIGEIKLAFKHAQNSEYTPAMLLALRAQGMGWGEVKKLAKSAPAPESDEPEAMSSDSKQPGKPENPGKSNKPDQPGKPDNPGNSNKPDQPGRPDNPGNSNKPDKPEKPNKPDKPNKP